MATWPGSLPQDIRIPTDYDQNENQLRTKMDAGPNKMRRRYTAVEKPLTTSMIMDGSQLQTLHNFYNTTLNGGVDRFDWTNPVDDATVEMRFVKFPRSRILSGGDTPADRNWMVNLELEIMP